MRIDILTLFPEMFAPLFASMIKRAQENGIVHINVIDIRDYTDDKHKTADDRPYGGGAGMVMKPEPLFAATEAQIGAEKPRIIITSPSGRPYNQRLAEELAQEPHLIIASGHYEGIDQRYIDVMATDVISLGDFVLTGGEIPALAIADSVIRLLPGALGDETSAQEESFSDSLLEYPHYTRPLVFRDMEVPEALQQGNHKEIALWRREKSLERTYQNRPDLLKTAALDEKDAAYIATLRQKEEKPFSLHAALLHFPVYNKKRHIINTSITNLDLHDIARAAKTYNLAGYYIIQPIESQRALINGLLEHWQSGFGAAYNPDRHQALSLITLLPFIENAISDIETTTGSAPQIIVTGAGIDKNITGYPQMREIMNKHGGPYLLLFGTGWGLAQEIVNQADYCLQPIYGLADYNHLSVRSAASIIFDRLLGSS